ncbi:hypothetical protein CHARACLAT_018739 [Characodon lateralis]|uniref:Uncharacterized protein n=1 Tax=Characodon lateralis TaxID=208331 RepID=A0ABU7CPT0_9TELE|nr:hypothetical protein [Characodon lateralis]
MLRGVELISVPQLSWLYFVIVKPQDQHALSHMCCALSVPANPPSSVPALKTFSLVFPLPYIPSMSFSSTFSHSNTLRTTLQLSNLKHSFPKCPIAFFFDILHPS